MVSELDKVGLREAAQAFVDKIDAIHADPAFQSVWTVNQIHVGSYTGPTYTAELAALRSALISSPSHVAPANPAQLTDADLTARLKEIAVEVFPSANKFAVADGVKSIIRILERIKPAEYAVLHRSMYPFSYSAPTEDDGQPDEAQEWYDYDPDC